MYDERVNTIDAIRAKVSWDYYRRYINSEDAFITCYYHYLRIQKWFDLLTYVFALNMNINTCLDIGCNRGYFSVILGELGIQVDALDLHLNHSTTIEHPNVKYWQADFLEWDTSQKYDLILSLEIYEHIPVQRRTVFMEKVASSLNGGGFLLFSGPNCLSPYYGVGYLKSLVEKCIGRIDSVDWHYRIPFTHYNSMFSNYNLEIVQWSTTGLCLCFSNALENLLSILGLHALLSFDERSSAFLRGIGANYACIATKKVAG